MAHSFCMLNNAPSYTYYPDSDETVSGGSGATTTQVTGFGDTALESDFAQDGSEDAVIRMIAVSGAPGTAFLLNSAGTTIHWSTALSGNTPFVVDFGTAGMRIPTGFQVIVPANCWFLVVYDKDFG